MSRPLRPPLVARVLLRLRPLGERRQDVEADFDELFRSRATEIGLRPAQCAYLRDVLSLWVRRRPGLSRLRFARGWSILQQDVRFGLRIFRRQPALFAVAVAGLAVAIGMTTAVFCVVNALCLRGNGIADASSVYRVGLATANRSDVPWTYADYARVQAASSSVRLIATTLHDGEINGFNSDSSDPEMLRGEWTTAVSGPFFSVLGAPLHLGRALLPHDDAPGAARVIVVSHAFWSSRLNGDPAVIGRSLRLSIAGSDSPVTVVGVADRRFTGPTGGSWAPPAGWMTFSAQADAVRDHEATTASAHRSRLAALRNKPDLNDGEREALRTLEVRGDLRGMPVNLYVRVFARPEHGVTMTQAEADIDHLRTALGVNLSDVDAQRVHLRPFGDERAVSVLGFGVPMLMAAMTMVVALACGNLTNLLLASAAGRSREIGMRFALGAGRGRVVRQLLTESLMLGIAGSVAGLGAAVVIARSIARIAELPELLDVSPDPIVYGFVASLAVGIGLLAGLAPARFCRRADALSAIKSNPAVAPNPFPRSRLRSWLVGGQAAGSLALLILAALLTRSLVSVVTTDTGLAVDRLVTYQGLGYGYDVARARTFWNLAQARIAQIDGAQATALSNSSPFEGYGPVRLRGGRIGVQYRTSAEYFATVGVPIVWGRNLRPDEIRAGASVCLISERLANLYWGTENPLGTTLDRVLPAGTLPAHIPARETQIVGVVGESTTSLSVLGAPAIYLPLPERNLSNATLVIRTRDDPRLLAGMITATLEAIDPELTHRPRFVADGMQREVEHPKRLAMVGTTVGAIALGLALIGLMGVTAFATGQRRHEISVRIALGATRASVLRLLLHDNLRPVGIGMVVGLVGALIAGQFVRITLYGIRPYDPIAIVIAVSVLLAAATAAVFLPARRATALDPAQVLRQS